MASSSASLAAAEEHAELRGSNGDQWVKVAGGHMLYTRQNNVVLMHDVSNQYRFDGVKRK